MVSAQQDRIFGQTGDTAIKAPIDCAWLAPLVLSGEQVVDGFQTAGSRVLVGGQADHSTNGIYISGTSAWIRAADFDGTGDCVVGTLLSVVNGTIYGGAILRMNATANPPIIGQDGITFSPVLFLPSVASAVDYISLQASATASPVAYVSLNAIGTDAKIGVKYKSKGTTITGGQYYGASDSSGKQFFQINGSNVLELTDTWWNPNISYQGAPTAWPVISSGALAGGPDNIAVIGCNSSIYPATATGVTLMYCTRGSTGSHHFTTNGVVGHVTIAAITNPNGNDIYCGSQSALWLSGVGSGGSGSALISTQGSTGNGTLFYDSGTGGYSFKTDNLAVPLFRLNRIASAVNSAVIDPSVTGLGPNLYPEGPDGAITMNISSKGTNGIVLNCFGGTVAIARFNYGGGGNCPVFSSSATNPSISTTSGDLLLTSTGGSICFGTYTNTPATSAGYISVKDAAGNVRKLMVGT